MQKKKTSNLPTTAVEVKIQVAVDEIKQLKLNEFSSTFNKLA